MIKKIYVCHANECVYNKQGSCDNDSDVVTIGTYNGGPAICPNFTKDEGKLALIEGLYQVLVGLLLEDHGDEMKEDVREFELHTNSNGDVFMSEDESAGILDICVGNEKVVAIVDAINVLKHGRVLKIAEV